MNAIFKKLNYKDQDTIYVLNAPESFGPEMAAMMSLAEVKTTLGRPKEIKFALSFVTKEKEVDHLADRLAPLCAGDVVIWFAYPKGSSKEI
jgi:hypothetical protein